MPLIYDRLKKLDNTTRYPWHMPGHKRNKDAGPLSDIMAIDITEIDGFDDLHDADGIILDAQKRAARLYGSDEAFFLVNGSTSGVLAAVSAALSHSGERRLAAGRNSHQSLLHAAYLMRAEITWISEDPVTEKKITIPGVVTPGEVMSMLDKAAVSGCLPQALFVTSPSYLGVVADVPSIVEIAHSHGIPVIVDEAHGAHFGFGDGMPDSAVHAGADLVIQSVHKTLPSLTQTALLHVQGNMIDRCRLRRFLRIYQTSSPSYVLMASIDACMDQLENQPYGLIGGAVLLKQVVLQQCENLKKLHILSSDTARDPCRILISTAGAGISGRELYDILLDNYSLQPEMAGYDYCLMILTGMDTEDGLEALLWALAEIDGYLVSGALKGSGGTCVPLPPASLPEAVMPIYEAWDAENDLCGTGSAAGRICAEPVVIYPPGVPVILPGERYDDNSLGCIDMSLKAGLRLRGITQGENGPEVRVIR